MNQQGQNKILFSVIIPTFQRPDALKISLNSLSLQDFPRDNFEVIVCNNCPKDKIDGIVDQFRKFGLNISSIEESRPGAHFARNSGVDVAKGEYILFIDDDCAAATSLLKSYQIAIEQFRPIIAGGRIDIYWDNIPPNWVIPFEPLMGKLDFGAGNFWLKKGQVVNGGNLLIQRDFILQIGGMEPDQIGKVLFGNGDVALSLSANRFGHNVLWVGSAKVWHHQKHEVNAKLNDLLRREFNNGMALGYAIQKQKGIQSIFRLMLTSTKLTLSSSRQLTKGILSINLSSIVRSLLIFYKIIGMHWFFFLKAAPYNGAYKDRG